MTSIGHSARRVLLAATMVALTACSVFEDNPYADFSIGKVDEKSAQTAAAILVGDPQVISRETLINDRLREVRHLEFMLQESVSQTFEPQIRRDLSVIEAFAGQLGISFNPAIGRDFARREDIESARAEIELIKLQNEIDELNKLRQTDPSNAALNPTNANMGTPTAITDPNTTSIETRLAEAAKKANDLVASLTPEPGKGPRARSSSLESSPEEHFEDLNAYRARIRQRLTEVGLDDVHDANGNALYRLQFTATVLPGAVKNKFGVLDLEIASAEARADQVSRLYQDWLVSLMRRGVEEQSAGNPVEWERLQTVMLQNELMDYVPLEHPVYTQKGLNDLILFTYPGHQDIVREAIDNPCIAEALEASAMSRELGDKCAKNDSGETITYDPGALSKNLIETFPSLSAIEVFLSSYRSELLRDGGAGEIELSHDLRALAAQLSKAAYGARDLREQGTSTAVDQAPQTAGVQAPGCWKEIEALPVPSSFVDTVVWHNGTECRWRGQPYTYQAQPTERVQRLSTLASAANSMQLAFSLAATLPTQGLGINAGAAASRTAVGLAEAIERTPLVIGYTDRQSLTQDADSTARFGYVFGPKAILEPEENQLVYRQIPANHPVYADVSVPGWWPEMLLKIRTAWAGNWHQGTGILNNMQPDGGRQISLRLRPQQRATATLTGFIADGLLPSGFESTTITEVIPNPVSACAGRIEFLIKGRNLWRGSEVYLRGKRHEGLRVLPDMRGLAVTFDMNSLPRTPDRVAPAEMIVWTSFGPGRYPIEIVDTVDGQPCAGSPEATDAIALRPHLPRFVNIAMAKLRVELVTPMPAAARDEKIAVELTTTTGEMLPEVEMDIANRLLGQWFEAATLVTLPTDLDAAEFDGAALRVGVSYQLSRDGRRYFSWAPETVVFYSAANQAKFQIATDQIDGFAAPVVLRAPVRLGRAYPKFNRVEEAFSATIEEHDKIPVHVVADWSSQPGMVVLNLAKGSGGAAEDAFVTAWCANPLNIKIGLTELAGDDQPELVTTNVVLQKRPAAECPVS